MQEFILDSGRDDALPAPEWMQTSDGHQYKAGRVTLPRMFIQFDGEMWFSQGMEHTRPPRQVVFRR